MLKQLLFDGESGFSPFSNLGLTILRIVAGFGMMTHGYSKIPPTGKFIETIGNIGFPMPTFFAWNASLAEFVGGALLILGLATRPASFLIAVTMAVALFGVHFKSSFEEKELALLYEFIALTFFFMGANDWSIDVFLRNKK